MKLTLFLLLFAVTPWKILLKKYVKELRKYGTCIGLSPSRQRQATPECESQLALKDLGKLWNSAYCSLIHFCVNEKHVLNLSREIRWISLLLSFCQWRFTVSTGIIVQHIPTCITSLCRGNLRKVELMIRTRNHVSQEIQSASNSESWILFLTTPMQAIVPKSKHWSSGGRQDSLTMMPVHWFQTQPSPNWSLCN